MPLTFNQWKRINRIRQRESDKKLSPYKLYRVNAKDKDGKLYFLTRNRARKFYPNDPIYILAPCEEQESAGFANINRSDLHSCALRGTRIRRLCQHQHRPPRIPTDMQPQRSSRAAQADFWNRRAGLSHLSVGFNRPAWRTPGGTARPRMAKTPADALRGTRAEKTSRKRITPPPQKAPQKRGAFFMGY